MKENEYGRSMIEMLGVLTVIGVLSVGGFDLITKANNSRQAAAVVDEIGSLCNKVRTVMRDYQLGDNDEDEDEDEGEGEVEEEVEAGDVTSYIYKGRAFPDVLKYEGGKFIGTEDVEYKIFYPGNDDILFALKVSELTSDMCMQIVTVDWGSRSTNGFLGLRIGGTTPSNTTGLSQSMGIGAASDACGEDDDDITIYFAFR